MDTAALSQKLLDIPVTKREHWERVLRDPVFTPVFNYASLDEQRQHPFKRMQKIFGEKLVSVKEFDTNPTNVFSSHEFVGLIDPATAIKHTVQMNLFGGTCLALHNGRHDYLFDEIDSLKTVGCFCFTELGYGNNAVEMETTITFDKEKDEFSVHSPTDLSQKYWISNGFHHANKAVVFGQTIVDGKREGINAFLVPIRDAQMQLMPGVQCRDMGIKIGVNGVDNAILRFNNVRIPRTNMLNKYCDVDASGAFQSKIKNLNARFFAVTERLLSGRICIAGIALGGTRGCLYVAIKYAQQRKSIGPEGLSTVPILNYQLQQNALLPLFARTLALNVFYNSVRDAFKNQNAGWEMPSLCSVVKTLMGWNYSKTATTCRERCGGMGFLSSSRFAEYLACAHTCLTAEGDNRVLMHKIVKDLTKAVTKDGYKLPQPRMNVKTQVGTMDDVSQLETLSDLFRFRQIVLLQKLGAKSHALIKAKVSAYDIAMMRTSDLTQELAQAYGERRIIDSCIDWLATVERPSDRAILTKVFRVFAIDCVKRDLGFYIAEKAVKAGAAANLLIAQNSLIKDMAAHIDDLVKLLAVPDDVLQAPISKDYVTYYSKPNFGEVVGAKL